MEEEEAGVVPGMSRRRTRGRPFGQLKKSGGGGGGGRNARLEWRKRRRLGNGGGSLDGGDANCDAIPRYLRNWNSHLVVLVLARAMRSMCEHGWSYPAIVLY